MAIGAFVALVGFSRAFEQSGCALYQQRPDIDVVEKTFLTLRSMRPRSPCARAVVDRCSDDVQHHGPHAEINASSSAAGGFLRIRFAYIHKRGAFMRPSRRSFSANSRRNLNKKVAKPSRCKARLSRHGIYHAEPAWSRAVIMRSISCSRSPACKGSLQLSCAPASHSGR